MKNYLNRVITLLAVGLASVAAWGQDDAAAITSRLVDDGFENVRVVREGHRVEVVLEENHYRGIFRGIGRALQLVSPAADSRDTIRLTVLEYHMPRLTVDATHVLGQWDVHARHGGRLSPGLKAVESRNSSAYKIDLVAYPSFFLSNSTFDRLWNSMIYLAPALEMELWPGASLFLQSKFLLWENYSNRYVPKVTLGYASLSQQLVSSRHWDVSAIAGTFSLDRLGLQVEATYHALPGLDLGVIANATGPWKHTRTEGLKFCNWDKYCYMANVKYYERHSNLLFDLKAGLLNLERKGVRFDVSRHIRDYSLVTYVEWTQIEKNMGCGITFPMGPKKLPKHRRVRARLPESFDIHFVENFDWRGYNYTQQSQEQVIRTRPDLNHSERFWQPEHIEEFVRAYLEGAFE